MADTAVPTRIHLLPPPGKSLFTCEKCGHSLADVRYASRDDRRYIRFHYHEGTINYDESQKETRKIICPHCRQQNTEPNFRQFLSKE